MAFQVTQKWHENTSRRNKSQVYPSLLNTRAGAEKVLTTWALLDDGCTLNDDGSLAYNGDKNRWTPGEPSIDLGDSTIYIEEVVS